MKNWQKTSGQALIIILLVMAVGLTIGLAIISRSVTDIKISTQEEESARAFSTAEAGIEQAFLSGPGTYEVGTERYQAECQLASECQGNTDLFGFGDETFAQGNIQTLWLVGHNAAGEPDPAADASANFPRDGTITACWGAVGTSSALEATLIYETTSGFKVARGAYDPDSSARGNNFSDADGNPADCGVYESAKEIDLSGWLASGDVPYALRLKLIYNNDPQPLAVLGKDSLGASRDFPSQGEGYECTASVEGETTKLQQCQFYKAPPEIFDYALFSGSNLEHN